MKSINYIKEYVDGKCFEYEKFKSASCTGKDLERVTNVGVFRHYIKVYLAKNSNIHDNMTFLVRQLAPTEKGLPLEIYVFTTSTNWVKYEDIQSDVFDHILTMVPKFGLSIYQDFSAKNIEECFSKLALAN